MLQALSFILKIFLWTILLAIIWFICWLFMGALAYGLPLFVILAYDAARRIRRARGERILEYLETAVRLNTPIPAMIDAAARTETSRIGRSLSQLAQMLSQGVPLGDALAETVPEVPFRQRQLINVAEHTGQLGPVLSEMVRTRRRPNRRYFQAMDWAYPLIVFYALCMMVAGLMVFVVPKFQEIFADFDAMLPATTVTLVQTANFLAGLGPDGQAGTGDDPLLPIIIILGPLVLIGSWILLIQAFRHTFGRPSRHPLLSWEGVLALAWSLPFIGRVVRDRQLADVNQVIAGALKASLPLTTALSDAQSLCLSPQLKRRLVRWCEGLDRGGSNNESAGQAKMPPLMVGLLSTAQVSGDPALTFEFLYRYYQARYSRAVELIRASVMPIGVLVMGSLVGFIVVACLSPVIELINRTADVSGL